MKKTERYVYPAIFTYKAGQEIAVVFPDLDVATSGTDDNDVTSLLIWFYRRVAHVKELEGLL